jgi:hypothetical protein
LLFSLFLILGLDLPNEEIEKDRGREGPNVYQPWPHVGNLLFFFPFLLKVLVFKIEKFAIFPPTKHKIC